jgi:hypothetical protein
LNPTNVARDFLPRGFANFVSANGLINVVFHAECTKLLLRLEQLHSQQAFLLLGESKGD